MTIRLCFRHADLISHPSYLYFLKHLYSLRNLIIFSTICSQQCFYITLEIVFFSVFLALGNFCRQYMIVNIWFPYAALPHVGCWLFLDLKCPCVSLVCSIWSLLSLTSYCLQLMWELSHAKICGLMYYSLLVLFSHFIEVLISYK